MITGKPAPLFFRNDYAQRLKKLFEPSIVSYLPLDEPGGSVAFDYSGNGRNGAYTAVTLGQPGIGDGRSAASFDGSTSYCTWYTAALAAAFNPSELTLLQWVKISLAALTDGAWHRVLRLSTDGNNIAWIYKTTTNSLFQARYIAGGTNKTVNITISDTNWHLLALTASADNDEVKAYFDGVQSGTTLTGLGTWVGALANAWVGAWGDAAAEYWSGLLAHSILLNRAATDAEIQEAYRMAF